MPYRAPMAAHGGGGRNCRISTQEETTAGRVGATLRGPSVVRRAAQWPTAWSSPVRNSQEPGQGATELGFPRPASEKVQGEAPRLAGDASGEGEEASPEGLGGCHRIFQSDACGPAGQIVGHHLHRHPGSIGGEVPRGEMVESDAVLQVSYGILDPGVAAMVGSSSRVSPSRSVMKPCQLYPAKRTSWGPSAGFTRRTMNRTDVASGLVWNRE